MTPINPTEAKERVKARIRELARELGRDGSHLTDSEVIPETGLLDSASLMVLIVWFEDEFGISTDGEELTLDNFGTVSLMIDYLQRHA